ncbi:MAG: MMPL family transporter [Actinomycetota bacterium]|nr:MMPL family transporter [Actinomycetota bacterium]
MRRIGVFVLTHRRLVGVGWLILFVAGAICAGAATKRLVIDFSLPGQPGTTAAQQIIKEFGNGGSTSPYLLTLTAPAGQTLSGKEATVAATFATAAQSVPASRLIDEATSADKVFRTKDDRTAYAMVFYLQPRSFTQLLPGTALTQAMKTSTPAGWSAGVTGEDALSAGNSNGSGPGVLLETLLGALGALFVLVFVFASFLALLPMLVAAASILLSFVFLLPLTYVTDMSFIVQFLISLIGLGVAIDYSLILVNRWREERDHGRENHEAVLVAMETAGRAVLFSGVTVAIGLAALVVLPVPFMRSIGIGGALIPLASVLTTLTLTPALLGGIGPKVDWPKIRHESNASRAWSGWARGVVKNRYVALGVAVITLGTLVVAFFGIRIGLAGSGSLAKNGPAYEAAQTLERGGMPKGELTPIQVLTTTSKATAVAGKLARVSGIDHVIVSTDPGNVHLGHTVVIAVPHEETANSATVGPVKGVRALAAGDPAVIGVAGLGADQIDFVHAVYGNFPLVLAIIALLTFALLARGFRSVLLPLKAIVLNLLTLGATLGFMVILWQDGHGSQTLFGVAGTGAVTFWVPLMVFAFLFGLSMDYEVFILSRIREEYDLGVTTDQAVITGIARTGRLVTSAALILFLAFVALASGPQTDLKVMASALGFGILLDATIVRSLLVPALVSLFGSWNWWLPDWLARLLRVPAEPGGVALAD